ncbi:MAG: hypothetical protein RLP02_29725 [Coleofasciculus sp. C2-GNP5-27]
MLNKRFGEGSQTAKGKGNDNISLSSETLTAYLMIDEVQYI